MAPYLLNMSLLSVLLCALVGFRIKFKISDKVTCHVLYCQVNELPDCLLRLFNIILLVSLCAKAFTLPPCRCKPE